MSVTSPRIYINFVYVRLLDVDEATALVIFKSGSLVYSLFSLKNKTWVVEDTWAKATITSVSSNGNVDTVAGYIDFDNPSAPLTARWSVETWVYYGADYQDYGQFQNVTVSLDASQNGGNLNPLLVIGGLGVAGAVAYYLWMKKGR